MKRISLRPVCTRPTLSALSLLLFVAVGCGSFPPPTERLNTTQAAIRAASEVGAEQIPRAALHLKLAQEQTDKARAEMNDDDNEAADLNLRRAQADAELAIAIARETQGVQKADEAEAELQKARTEVMKAQGGR
jgi:hypothetical protein